LKVALSPPKARLDRDCFHDLGAVRPNSSYGDDGLLLRAATAFERPGLCFPATGLL